MLLARIDRALARSGSADLAHKQLEYGGVSLDPVRAEVSYRSKIVELSRNELLILRILMENAGSIISRSELMDELWQTDVFGRRQHAYRKRESFAPQPAIYAMCPMASSPPPRLGLCGSMSGSAQEKPVVDSAAWSGKRINRPFRLRPIRRLRRCRIHLSVHRANWSCLPTATPSEHTRSGRIFAHI